MDDTIIQDSNLGKRLEKLKKAETMYIKFKGKDIPLASKITIGRDRDNQIFIEDKMASRHHALIQKLKDAFFIKDLNSTNGTFINGKKIPKDKYIRLNKNDVIKIGRTELTIRRFIE
jgi:pSer/pThr/pTyr-binding forkhead associated (FHA) protein